MTDHGTRARKEGGFTLLETLVVLGILCAFCLFLAQLMRSGVALFDEGETGQDLADRAHAAGNASREALVAITGPVREAGQGEAPEARLLVQRVSLGLAEKGAQSGGAMSGGAKGGGALVQVVRSTVQLADEDETELLRRRLQLEVRAELRGGSPEEVEKVVLERLHVAPRTGRGTMLLLPWPSGDAEGAYLDLRRGLFLSGERIELKQDVTVDLLEIEDLARGELTPARIVQLTQPIVSGLLHFEIAFWSQHTLSWEPGATGRAPEQVWDSARAGLLSASKDPRENFSMDLGAASLTLPSDDVWPRWLRITLIVDRSPNQRPDALLSRDLTASETVLPVLASDRLPAVDETPFLKVGGEWIRYRQQSGGSSLTGVQRGVRGTTASPHRAGTRVRAGKTIVLYVPLHCGKDNWNG